MLKLFHKKKRLAIVTGKYQGQTLLLSRNTADGKTVSVKFNNRWGIISTEELLSAVRYVTMPMDEFREVKDGLLS
jgi:hypothetical protein